MSKTQAKKLVTYLKDRIQNLDYPEIVRVLDQYVNSPSQEVDELISQVLKDAQPEHNFFYDNQLGWMVI